MFQRHHLPVHFVRIVKRGLATGLGGVVLHLFVDVGHLIQGDDASTEKDGLHHHNRSGEEVARICVEGIDETLADTVQLSAELLHLRITKILQVFQFHAHRTQYQTDILHRQFAGDTCNLALHTAHRQITQMRQGRLLLVVEQRDLPTGELIRTDGTHMGEVFGAGRLAEVLRDVLLHLGHTHLLVVAQGHRPTTVKRQQPLSTDRHRHPNKQNNT